MPTSDEVIVNAHFEQRGWGTPIEIVAYDQLPGMYRAEFTDGTDYLVIRDCKLLEQKGLEAAGAYLRDIQLLVRRPRLRDLTMLLEIFEALPELHPDSGNSPTGFYTGDDAGIAPRLELAQAGGELVLSYIMPGVPGPLPNPRMIRVRRMTLAIPPSYRLAWREEIVEHERPAP